MWKFKDQTQRIAVREVDGVCESCLAASLPEGTVIEAADPPEHNAVIDAEIAAIELANPITHRTQREFMIGVQTMLAGLLGITAEQLLDPQSPHYSHAYAKFVSVNAETITKRQERVP
jgi:hypothetical protein